MVVFLPGDCALCETPPKSGSGPEPAFTGLDFEPNRTHFAHRGGRVTPKQIFGPTHFGLIGPSRPWAYDPQAMSLQPIPSFRAMITFMISLVPA